MNNSNNQNYNKDTYNYYAETSRVSSVYSKKKSNTVFTVLISILVTLIVVLGSVVLLISNDVITFGENVNSQNSSGSDGKSIISKEDEPPSEVKEQPEETQKKDEPESREKKPKQDGEPQVWRFDPTEVENFVTDSLYAYVDGMNTKDISYADIYFYGNARQAEIDNYYKINSSIAYEEIISVNCHSVTRISPTKVSVIRDSTIRVEFTNGKVNDVVETYKYTIEYIDGEMYIVGISAI